jgi:hypothetical protein
MNKMPFAIFIGFFAFVSLNANESKSKFGIDQSLFLEAKHCAERRLQHEF